MQMYSRNSTTKCDSTLYCIASQDRSSGTASNFRINLPQGGQMNGTKWKLREVLLPQTMYNIRENVNNSVCIRVGATNYNLTVPPGGYNITTLMNAIQVRLVAVLGGSWSLIYDSSTMLVTFSNLSATPFILNWATSPYASTGMWKELGFLKQDSVSVTSTQAYQAPMLIQPFHVYLYINQLPPKIYTSNGRRSTFIIPITVNSSSLMVFEDSDYFQQKVITGTPTTIQQFDVSLTYADGTVIELNGLEWEFIMEVY